MNDDLKDRAKDMALGAATAVAAKGFFAWMDRLAKKPLFPRLALVKKFRRLTRRETEEDLREGQREMLESVSEYIQQIEDKRKKK